MKMKFFSLALVSAMFAFAASATQAAQMSIFAPSYEYSLPGVTQFDGWLTSNISSITGYPGFPGSTAWSTPIGSGAPESGDGTLMKTASGAGGGPYPATGSIYFGGFSGDTNVNGGQLTVADASPVANLIKVVFHLQIGEAWTYDFFNDVLPVLNYNGGAQALAPTTTTLLEAYFNGTVTMPSGEEPVYINTYRFEYILSSILDPITDFNIQFNGVQHAQVYALRLDQTDTLFEAPEPSSLALVSIALGGLIGLKRRRDRRLALV